VTIDRKAGSAVFDFAGTGPEIYGNLNAPPAVTASAIIYCLRCLLPDIDIPLNQVTTALSPTFPTIYFIVVFNVKHRAA
jgi:5-oxoprolinase (ATP-hydrolysing)